MSRRQMRGRRLRDIAEMSQFWDVEDLLRNFDEEMARLEQGLGHMVWDTDENRVTAWLSPLPMTPKFEATEDNKEFKLRINLPNVSKDRIRLNVDKGSIELFACSDDAVCRPYYMSIDAKSALDPDSTKSKFSEGVFEVRVAKAKKKRLKIR